MADSEYLKSLNIEKNIFELKEDTDVRFIIWLAAPGSGAGRFRFPAGTKFFPTGPMNDDTLYIKLDSNREYFFQQIYEQESKNYKDKIIGYSFFITEEEIKIWNLNFIEGSRDRMLEILQLIRKSNFTR